MLKKILIANRGEIACRIAKTAKRMGIRTVGVFSEADRHAKHVQVMDEAYFIGGPKPADSYLRTDRILEVAHKTKSEALHPGYGLIRFYQLYFKDMVSFQRTQNLSINLRQKRL